MSYASFSLKNFNYDYDLLLYTETRRHKDFFIVAGLTTPYPSFKRRGAWRGVWGVQEEFGNRGGEFGE